MGFLVFVGELECRRLDLLPLQMNIVSLKYHPFVGLLAVTEFTTDCVVI